LVFSTPITIKQDRRFAIKREPKLYRETICADFALFESIGYVFDRKLKYFVICDSSQEKSLRSKKALSNYNVTFEPKSIKPNNDKTSFEITFKRLLRKSNVHLKDTILILKLY
jgi:FPC/CPF motif-containing protein YcgG